MATRFSIAVLVLVSATAFMHAEARNLHGEDTTTKQLPQSSETLPLQATAPKREPSTVVADKKNFVYGAGIGGGAGMGGFLGMPLLPIGGSPLLGGLGGTGGYGGSGGASSAGMGGALGGSGGVGGGGAAAGGGVPISGGILPSP